MRTRGMAVLLVSVVLGATGMIGAPARGAGLVPVRVEPGGLAASGVRASWVESYGSFDWAEVAEADLGRLRTAGVAFEAHPEAHTLVLPAASFDPLVSVPSVDAARLPLARPALYLVQLRAPTKDAWLDALRARGARLVQFIAPFSYVVMLSQSQVAGVSALPFVRWVGAFDPSYRFADDLSLDGVGALGALLIDDGHVQDALAAIGALGVSVERTARLPFMDVDAVGVELRAPAAALPGLVQIPSLYSLSPVLKGQPRDEMSSQIAAGNYNAQGVPQDGYTDWLQARGVTGDGVIVAHVDDGFSTGHPDTVGTVAGCRNYAVPGGTCDAASGTLSDFHGQHTGGIIVARGTVPSDDASGFRHGQGVAPGAKLYVQNYIALEAFFGYSGAGQYQRLNRDSVLGGATVSANSWGPAGTPRGYDADTREFDFAPRDANLDTPQHEPLAFVLSIMNGSGGTSTQGTPDEGKNLLRVGSSKNYRAGNIRDLSSSTAHGPALDGRRLPDVVAPGERVISTGNPVTIGFCSALQLDPLVSPWAALYASCTGTSMASPHVSGASALFTEWYRDRFGAGPSPALQKAALVNGAVDLFGARDADGGPLGHIPDNKQGWGRINLENVFAGTEKAYLDQTVLLGASGESFTATVEPVDPSKPVKITLVWTDAPGHGMGGSTPAWVNDLDLRVTDQAQTVYLGNAFGSPSTGWSVPGGSADFKNNIENVYLQQASGPVSVEVVAANIAGDGVPGTGDETDQDFALVVSNGRLTTG